MVRKLGLIFLLLLAVNVSAIDLDSTRQVRVATFNLLGVDTTGVNGLSAGQVDNYINLAINEVNDELDIYKRTELVVTAGHSNFVTLDSAIRVISCMFVNGDTIIGLNHLYSSEVVDSVLAKVNTTESDRPTDFYFWGDSLCFVPTPNRIDTFQVHYLHLIPNDSLGIIPRNYRNGVLYYACMLAATDLNSTRLPVFEKLYYNFINRKRGSVAVEN